MNSNFSRRKFLRNTSLTLGAGSLSLTGLAMNQPLPEYVTPPHIINIGTVSIMDLTATSPADMVQKVLGIMEEMLPSKPDIICLPEVFAFTNLRGYEYKVEDVAETVPGHVVQPFMRFAAKNKCYVICPTYVKEKNNVYIGAVLVNREGKVEGTYNKMRPAEQELKIGIKAGRMDPQVFETDFGKIGIQICFDIKYEEGWTALKDQGAQIIFWPSAYAAGREISSRAWKHQVYIVTSTQKDTSRICDVTGEAIAQTSRWQPNWICAPVNLQKAFIITWPSVSLFPDILKKYGNRIRLNTYSEEEWTIIESVDPTLKIADVLKEFNLVTMHESLKNLSMAHAKARK